jgi:hypothetical protein
VGKREISETKHKIIFFGTLNTKNKEKKKVAIYQLSLLPMLPQIIKIMRRKSPMTPIFFIDKSRHLQTLKIGQQTNT